MISPGSLLLFNSTGEIAPQHFPRCKAWPLAPAGPRNETNLGLSPAELRHQTLPQGVPRAPRQHAPALTISSALPDAGGRLLGAAPLATHHPDPRSLCIYQVPAALWPAARLFVPSYFSIGTCASARRSCAAAEPYRRMGLARRALMALATCPSRPFPGHADLGSRPSHPGGRTLRFAASRRLPPVTCRRVVPRNDAGAAEQLRSQQKRFRRRRHSPQRCFVRLRDGWRERLAVRIAGMGRVGQRKPSMGSTRFSPQWRLGSSLGGGQRSSDGADCVKGALFRPRPR